MQAAETLSESIPVLMQWLAKFRVETPQQDSKVAVGWRDGLDAQEGFCVRSIADIEESIWAPKYGLKGKIDASVQAVFIDQSKVERPAGYHASGAQSQYGSTKLQKCQASDLSNSGIHTCRIWTSLDSITTLHLAPKCSASTQSSLQPKAAIECFIKLVCVHAEDPTQRAKIILWQA